MPEQLPDGYCFVEPSFYIKDRQPAIKQICSRSVLIYTPDYIAVGRFHISSFCCKSWTEGPEECGRGVRVIKWAELPEHVPVWDYYEYLDEVKDEFGASGCSRWYEAGEDDV